MYNTTVYKSVTIGQTTWQIIKKNGVYHWKGPKRNCYNCPKIAFDYEDVAMLYSNYMFVKYGRHFRVYWDDYCGEWHLTTSYRDMWAWI